MIGLLLIETNFNSCTHRNLTEYNYNKKQITVVFLEKDEAFLYIQKSNFINKMNRLNMAIRLDYDRPPIDNDSIRINYQNFLYENLKNWYGFEKNIVWGATEQAINELEVFSPTLLPDTLYFINTSMRLEFNAFFTIDNAICIPASVVWPVFFDGLLKNKIIHEMYHIYSRYHPEKRDSLYTLFNFIKVDTVNTGSYLQSKMIINPDVHSNNYVLKLKDSTGVTKNLLLAVELDEVRYNDNRGIISFLALTNIFGYFESHLYELENHDNNIFEVTGINNPNPIDYKIFKNSLDTICGCLATNKFFAEEIVADAFMFCLESNSDPDLLTDCSSEDKQRIKKILQIIRNEN